jgi:outer membrane lipoprotein-sorting protein
VRRLLLIAYSTGFCDLVADSNGFPGLWSNSLRSISWVFGFLIVAAVVMQGQTASVEDVVSHLERAQADNQSNLRPYTATREYRVLSGEHDERLDSAVKASVSFVPPDKQKFTIDSASGNERGIAAIKRILESESEMRDAGTSAGFTRQNYDFAMDARGSADGRQCYILTLKPKHREKQLIAGRIWVDAQNYLPRKVEGELAKSPSWWVKNVHVVLHFADVNGMWLQSATEAIAELRVFGRHTLTSQAMNFASGEQVASLRPTAAPVIHRQGASTAALQSQSTAVNGTRKTVRRRPTQPVPVVLGTGVLVAQ